MRRYVLVTALIILIITPLGHSAAAGAQTGCGASHAEHILARDRQAVVYQAYAGNENTWIYGCAYGHHRHILGPPPEYSSQGGRGIAPVALGGTAVAYGDTSVDATEPDLDRFWIVTQNLVTGRIIRKVPKAESIPPGGIGRGGKTQLVVKPDGSVAWMISLAEEQTLPQVWVSDHTGTHLLASSTTIQEDSLKLTGNTLTWTENGKHEHATLR